MRLSIGTETALKSICAYKREKVGKNQAEKQAQEEQLEKAENQSCIKTTRK
ncbi:hypothetical protein ACUYFE_08030 [Olegusella massiliensis]|uniref:hypothetical protein n=1 Tax=Olegusella massiliensis TaxID=1776381 RepID=UPI0040555D81